MALWEEYTFATIADYLSKLAAFGTANGWVVTTSTTTTVVMSKAGMTFTSVDGGNLSVSRSLTFGGRLSGTVTEFQLSVGYNFGFISCGSNLFFYSHHLYSTDPLGPFFGGVMQIVDKIGAWSGGPLISCSRVISATRLDYFLQGTMVNKATLFYEGAWTTIGAAAAGRPHGSIGAERVVAHPNYFNAATLPIPILISQYDTNTSYLHPIGFAPCVFRASRGTVYAVGDIITISGEQYLRMYNSLLFKVS